MPHSELVRPRRPVRANGQRTFDQLVNTVEAILQNEGVEALTIQAIAQRSGVPKTSVYHFFPSTSAACIALAEGYFEELGRIIEEPTQDVDGMGWQNFVEQMMGRAIDFYNRNECASQLILGSNYSWHVRQADMENNRVMASALLSTVCKQFNLQPERRLKEAMVIAISIGETIWSISIAEEGKISKRYARESYLAVCSYFANYFE